LEGDQRDVEALRRLDALTRRLRRECPWDREQDERSIVPHTVEEAYELAAAAHGDDDAKLLDELGDVLFQVHFLALLLEERGAGSLADVAEHVRQKLIRRHPHVFAGVEVADADEVNANWETIKAAEKGRESALEGIPIALPALARADKLLSRVERAALDGLSVPQDATPVDRIGGRLLDVVREARSEGVDAEQALRVTLARYGEAVRTAERSPT
jgi:MazG family protein